MLEHCTLSHSSMGVSLYFFSGDDEARVALHFFFGEDARPVFRARSPGGGWALAELVVLCHTSATVASSLPVSCPCDFHLRLSGKYLCDTRRHIHQPETYFVWHMQVLESKLEELLVSLPPRPISQTTLNDLVSQTLAQTPQTSSPDNRRLQWEYGLRNQVFTLAVGMSRLTRCYHSPIIIQVGHRRNRAQRPYHHLTIL